MFWGAAALLGIGLVAPSDQDQENESDSRNKRRTNRPASSSATSRSTSRATSDQDQDDDKETRLDKFEERRRKAMRKRIARVYNPWRWRFWMAAVITFGFSVLFGVLG
jgi:hypothetical protein